MATQKIKLSNNNILQQLGGYSLLGRQRLARLVKASLKIQGLSTRDVEELSVSLYGKENRVNKNTTSSLSNGRTTQISVDTLAKFSPLTFRIEKFLLTERDPVGQPLLVRGDRISFETNLQDPYIGDPVEGTFNPYSKEQYEALKETAQIQNLPEFELRCISEEFGTSFMLLQDVLLCKTPVEE